MMMSFYSFARWVVKMIFFALYRINVIGVENIPKTGKVIICSNHLSNLDPPTIGITTPRPIYFMAKQELFQNPFLRLLMSNLHAFPVKRGTGDREALRKGLQLLDEGKVFCLFPEGTRSKTGELGKPLAGAGFFAKSSKAAVVPAVIIGPYKVGKRLKVVYGKPIDPTILHRDGISSEEISEVIMKELQALLDQHPRSSY